MVLDLRWGVWADDVQLIAAFDALKFCCEPRSSAGTPRLYYLAAHHPKPVTPFDQEG